MGQTNSKIEKQQILDVLIPSAFRECVTDLSTEHLTETEKRRIKNYVHNYVETYYESRQYVGEQLLLSDFSYLLF